MPKIGPYYFCLICCLKFEQLEPANDHVRSHCSPMLKAAGYPSSMPRNFFRPYSTQIRPVPSWDFASISGKKTRLMVSSPANDRRDFLHGVLKQDDSPLAMIKTFAK